MEDQNPQNSGSALKYLFQHKQFFGIRLFQNRRAKSNLPPKLFLLFFTNTQDPINHQASLILQRILTTRTCSAAVPCVQFYSYIGEYTHPLLSNLYRRRRYLKTKNKSRNKYAEALPKPVIWLALHGSPQPLPQVMHPQIRWSLRKVPTAYKHLQKQKKIFPVS